MKLVVNAAALTRALELDNPEAGGIFPDTITRIPAICDAFGSSSASAIPLMPHKK